MQTWYCSVSLRWKRTPGGGAFTSGARTRRPFPGGRARDVLVRHAGVHDRVLARRRRVELRAHRVERLRDLLRGVRPRALEQQVLDEVRDARPLIALVA